MSASQINDLINPARLRLGIKRAAGINLSKQRKIRWGLASTPYLHMKKSSL